MLLVVHVCMCVVVEHVWLDQADGQEVQEGEEVTLMDWGNAIIKVRLICLLCCCESDLHW
jgi:hypothetical protein